MLQLGGVQEAEIAEPPTDVMEPVAVSFDPGGTVITLGDDELQVRGTPVITVPVMSVTVVESCNDPVCPMEKVGAEEPFTAS